MKKKFIVTKFVCYILNTFEHGNLKLTGIRKNIHLYASESQHKQACLYRWISPALKS